MDARLELPSAPVLQRSRLRAGHGFPLGATWTGLGVNFALFSAHATKVELCLFDEQGEREIERIELPEFTDEVWHGFLPDIVSIPTSCCWTPMPRPSSVN
jgi:isoamylase